MTSIVEFSFAMFWLIWLSLIQIWYFNKSNKDNAIIKEQQSEIFRLQRELSNVFDKLRQDINVLYVDVNSSNRDFSAGWNSALKSAQYKVQRIAKETKESLEERRIDNE